jgi:hypothetical protein
VKSSFRGAAAAADAPASRATLVRAATQSER